MSTLSRRADALDALRGLAILLMVLSGSIHFPNPLPAWMYHAQVPPPEFTFNPLLPGITWVDLVFPFFLFAMGAAFPFGLTKKLEGTLERWQIIAQIFYRGILLVSFAIFIQHTKPFLLSSDPSAVDWLMGLFSFIVLFGMFVRIPESFSQTLNYIIKGGAFLCAGTILTLVRFPDGSVFSLNRSDIIIIVLANVAVFGSLIWMYTREKIFLRLGILGILMALRLTQNIEGSWNSWLWNFSPFPWMYKLYYLQYLFIVIPGTIVGDMIHHWMKYGVEFSERQNGLSRTEIVTVLMIMVAMLVTTVAGLYARYVLEAMILNMFLGGYALWLLRKARQSLERLYKSLFHWGIFWLMLGFFFEAYEGGIKKDHGTMSYYFVTSGLAIICYIAFSIVIDRFKHTASVGLLIDNGKNPLIAYVAGNLLVLPILSLTSLTVILNYLTVSPWLGFLKGVIFTLLVAYATSFFTKKRLFWRM